jgi:hypothetical protein
MNSSNVALINQTNGGAVSPDTLQQYADALQYQVDNHVAPTWDVHANISVLDAGAAPSPGTLLLNIVSYLDKLACIPTTKGRCPPRRSTATS